MAIGATIKILDTPTAEMAAQGIQHAIGTDKYPAPQGTLMATLIKGILSFNLDWQFVLVGVFIAVVMELCGIKSLSFAIGIYLPYLQHFLFLLVVLSVVLLTGEKKKEN